MSRTRSLAVPSLACGALALSVVVGACAPMARPSSTKTAPAGEDTDRSGINVTGTGDVTGDDNTATVAQAHKSWAIVWPQGTVLGAPVARSASAAVLAQSAGSCALVDVDGAGHKRESSLMTFGVDAVAPACALAGVDNNDDALVLVRAHGAVSIHSGDASFALAYGDTLAVVFDRAGVLLTALALSDVDVRAMIFDRARGFTSLEREQGDAALHFRERRASSGAVLVDTRYADVVDDSGAMLARDGDTLRAFFVVTPRVLGHRLGLPGSAGALSLPASLDGASDVALFLALDDTGVARAATAVPWAPAHVAAVVGGFVASGTSASPDALSFLDLMSSHVTSVTAPGAHTLLLARIDDDGAVLSSSLRVDGQALGGDAAGGFLLAHPEGLVRVGADLAIDGALAVDAAG
ncbi:MAG TPA: hypothetical protein VGO62_03570, partial [Myxococcota bacterium]